MNVARERFATRARLADDQHRRLVRGDLLGLLAQRVHRAALADRRDQRRHERAAGLPAIAPGIERALDRAQELGERQRLLDEIERAEPRRFDRGLDRAVARHHHDRAGGAVRLRPFAQQRDAVGVRHPDVQQHEVGIVLRADRARLGRRPRRRPLRSLRPRGSPSGARGSRIHRRRPVCALRSCTFPPRSRAPLARRSASGRRRRAAARSARAHRRSARCRPRFCRHVLRQSSSRSPAPGPCPSISWSRTGRTPGR